MSVVALFGDQIGLNLEKPGQAPECEDEFQKEFLKIHMLQTLEYRMSVLSTEIVIMPKQTSRFLPSLRLQSRHGPNISWLLREGNLPSAVERKLLQSKEKWRECNFFFL